MMAVRIEKLLKRYLDELIDETLREFQWHASLDGRIPRYKLHNVAREDTVDCLVQVHGEDEAASVTCKIFSDMNQNNLANRLTQALEDRKTELQQQPVVSSVRPSQRDEVSTVRPNQRDEPPVVLDDLCCSISLLLFNDPVAPQCGHSFCKRLQELRGTQECPLCQKVLLKTELAINYSLKDLCESYREQSLAESHQTPSSSVREKRQGEEKTNKVCFLDMVAEKRRDIDSYANTLEMVEDMGADDESTQYVRMLLEREKLEHRVCRKLLGAIEDMMPLV